MTAGKRIKVAGTIRPFRVGQQVTIVLNRGKKTVKRVTVKVQAKGKGSSLGQFHFSRKMVAPGMYRIQALLHKGKTWAGSKDGSRPFRIRYPSLKKGNSGPPVKALNELLDDLGYVSSKGSHFTSATGRAVLAYRKVNNMARKEKATGSIFKKLAKGKGGFKLKHPGAGKHVEADLSRQVMVLAKHGEVDEIYTISSGAPATPDDPGQVPLLPQGRRLQQPRDVLLGLLHPRLRDPRLPRRPDLSGQPRLLAQPDPRLGPHLQLDRSRRPDLRLQLTAD